MLATSRAPMEAHGWAVEPKLDGWRAMVYVEDVLRVCTRSGRGVTSSLPELAGIADAVPNGTILDGELVAGQGRAEDFYRLGPSMMAKRRANPLTFVAFDVLHLAGESTVGLTYTDRRRLLEVLEFEGPNWCTVPSFDANAERRARRLRQPRPRGPGGQADSFDLPAGQAVIPLAQDEVRRLAGDARADAARRTPANLNNRVGSTGRLSVGGRRLRCAAS